jgi:quercetin dioxygenase-like cupin family protein
MESELPLEEFIDPENTKDIVSSQTYRDGDWQRLTKLAGFPAGVGKSVIPVDAKSFRILVLTQGEPNTQVASHSHDEAILRYIVQGSLTINGTTYREGEWVLVPAGLNYTVESDEGYFTIAGYGEACTG